MFNPPKTREEAEKYRYNQWAGNPNGWKFNPKQCAYEACCNFDFYQCSRPSGHGPDGLYCKQHARMVEGRK